jgi:hypothetical protein
MPCFNGGDDFVWICGPGEGFGSLVVLFEEAIDRGLKVGDGSEHASLQSPLREYCENPSTALSQDAEVGVKWKVQRG